MTAPATPLVTPSSSTSTAPIPPRGGAREPLILICRGIESVLARRNRVTATLREYIVAHDITRDRELDATLRQIDAEPATWMKTAGP